jgi:hypothetical protein
MATLELSKLDSNCSNIYFIDENICAGDSLQLINNNIVTLSSNMVDLSRNLTLWNSIYSNFLAASGLMVSTILNVENIDYTVKEAFNCVQTLSGNWSKQISLYFPTMYNITEWNNLNDLQKDSLFLNPWLTINFRPEFFPDNQIINLFVSTNQDIPFEFSFSRSLEENCAPNGGVTTLSCNGCGSGNQGQYRSQGCNHHGGAAGYGACDNAFTYCGNPTSTTSQNSNYTCIANGGQRVTGSLGGPLAIGLYDVAGQGNTPARISPIRSNDTCFARVFSYKYLKTSNDIDGSTWNIIL